MVFTDVPLRTVTDIGQSLSGDLNPPSPIQVSRFGIEY